MRDDKEDDNNVIWATFRKPEEPPTLEEMYARLITDFDNCNSEWQRFCNHAIIDSYNEAIDKVLELVEDQELKTKIAEIRLPEPLDD